MVIDSLGMGGAERITLTLAKLFIAKGHTVDIISIYDHIKYDIPPGVMVHTLGYKKVLLQNYRYRKKLFALVDQLSMQYQNGFDLILVHLLKAARLIKGYKHDYLYHVIHNAMSKEMLTGLSGAKRNRKLQRMQKKFAGERLITVSQGVADDIVDNMYIKAQSIQLIYNPINISDIRSQSEGYNFADKYLPYIVHVGRFVEQKRHDRLIEAYAKCKIDAKLVLVGEGKLRPRLEAQIKKLGLESKVILVGNVDNPYPIIKDASLLVLSSDFEGLSMAILEALALEVPVVSTDCPSGPREILGGYLEDSLVPLGDNNELAYMIAKQYSKPQKIADNILDRFKGDVIIEKYLALARK